MSRKILLVEDDRDIREALVDILELEGFQVTTAVHGQDALDQLRGMTAPELILLDLRMPVLDGAQFRAAQLAEPALSKIPVILMSADHDLEGRSRGLAVNAFVRKPIEIDKLYGEIKNVCG